MLAGRAAHVFRAYTTLQRSSSTPACPVPESAADLLAAETAARSSSSLPAQTCSCTLLATHNARQSMDEDRLTSCVLPPSLPVESTIPKNLRAAPARQCSDRAGSIPYKSPAELAVPADARRQGRC